MIKYQKYCYNVMAWAMFHFPSVVTWFLITNTDHYIMAFSGSILPPDAQNYTYSPLLRQALDMLLVFLLKDDQKMCMECVISELKCLIADARLSYSLFPSINNQDCHMSLSRTLVTLIRKISLVNLHFTSSLTKNLTFIVVSH